MAITYLQLHPDIEAAISSDQKRGWINPYRCGDAHVIRREDKLNDKATLTRTAFGRDLEKLINIPAYSRYADKTQVFSMVENDDISRRSLHVQLVSRIARNIGRILGLNTELIEAIALGHDIGHTPFGHAGERFLNELYHQRTGRFFNHNVHSVRVLDHLYRRNTSLQTLDGVLCHNGELEQQILYTNTLNNFKAFDALVEGCYRDQESIARLRPSTLEGCVVRVSDMIAYLGKDRQDAHEMGIINSHTSFESTVIGETNAAIINNLTVDIVNNSYHKDKIIMSEEVFADLKRAKKQNYELIYLQEGVLAGTGNIVQSMFTDMYEQLTDDVQHNNEGSPLFKHHVDSLNAQSKTFDRKAYLEEGSDQIVVDYMASMTDSYFIALYAHLFPRSEKRIIAQAYCDSLV